jgi:hypothetical protein
MQNRWSDDKATQFVEKYGERWGQDLAIGLYAASLIGAEDKLVLHGGGNSSVKTVRTNLLGEGPYDLRKSLRLQYGSSGPTTTRLDLNYLKKLLAPTFPTRQWSTSFRTTCWTRDPHPVD